MNRLEVLVATMNQKDFSKFTEMKIQTNAVFANQTNIELKERAKINGKSVYMISTKTRGVGMNRNIAIDNSNAEIVLFADDDVQYVDGYEKIILDAFDKIKSADAIIFNIELLNSNEKPRKNVNYSRVHFFNAFNYGAVRIAVKRKILIDENIRFNLNFGGGTKYSAGEDTLFIWDLLKQKKKVFVCPQKIANVDASSSTWFKGFNRKYFYDKGAIFEALLPRLSYLLWLQDLVRHYQKYKISTLSIYDMNKEVIKGIFGYRTLLPYNEKGENI